MTRAPLVFLNYRGKDTASAAVYLEKCLHQAYGRSSVFLDHQSIPLGHDFEPTILDAVRNSAVLLALIGDGWLSEDDSGRRPIDHPDDWVRREILTALASKVLVVPVLIGEVPQLDAADLPPGLATLARLQHARIRHRHQPQDARHLIERLTTECPALREAGPAEKVPHSSSIRISNAKGIQIGDHGTMHNRF